MYWAAWNPACVGPVRAEEERVRSETAAAKARGQPFGRRPGYRPSDKHAPEVMRLIEEEGHLQRRVAERIDIWKTTVNGIVKRHGEKKDSPAVPRA